MQWAFACNSQLPAVVCVGGATECCKACCSLGAHADVSLLCGCCCWVLAPVVLDCYHLVCDQQKGQQSHLGSGHLAINPPAPGVACAKALLPAAIWHYAFALPLGPRNRCCSDQQHRTRNSKVKSSSAKSSSASGSQSRVTRIK